MADAAGDGTTLYTARPGATFQPAFGLASRARHAADGATERVHAAITWAGGHQTHADLRRPVARIDQLSYYPALTERIRALAGQGLDSTAIAGQLAAEGFRTPRLHDRFHPGEIQHLIRRLGLRPGLDHDHRTDRGSLGPGQWWLAALAREIGMPAARPDPTGWMARPSR